MITGKNPFRIALEENETRVPNVVGPMGHLFQQLQELRKHETEVKKAMQELAKVKSAVLAEINKVKAAWEAELGKHDLEDLEVELDETSDSGEGWYTAQLEASWVGGDETMVKALETTIDHVGSQHGELCDFEFAPSEPHGSWFITLSVPYPDFESDADTFMKGL